MSLPVVAGAGALALALVVLFVSYNRFVRQRNHVRESWSNVDTELRRRYDLIPNLVDSVKGYASHERDTLEALVRARAEALADQGPPRHQAGTERELVRDLRGVLALAEQYPALRADAHFLRLQDQLVETEDRIQLARRLYNANVRDLNRRVQAFPSNVTAALFGFREAEYFEIGEAVRAPVPVG